MVYLINMDLGLKKNGNTVQPEVPRTKLFITEFDNVVRHEDIDPH